MIDIFLVERKEKIYRKDFLLRRVFRIGRKQPKQCGVKLWATYIYIYIYIYIYKPHNDVNGVKYHQTQNSSLHSVTIITLMTSVSFDHPFSLDENH